MIEVRRGICRTVLLIGPYAIKVPRVRGALSPTGSGITWTVPRAVLANQSERDWSGVQGVAPVLHSWLGGLVNVYPRCEPYPEGEDYPEPSYEEIGDGWLPRDRKRSNVGFLLNRAGGGQLVWLDYDGSWNGCPHSLDAGDLTNGEAIDRVLDLCDEWDVLSKGPSPTTVSIRSRIAGALANF